MSRVEKVFLMAGAAVAVIGLLFIAADDYAHAQQEQSRYCEMVQLYKDTQGENGWPAFRGESECQ